MSLDILVRPAAEEDIKDVVKYLNDHNQKAAYAFVHTLQKVMVNMATFPTMGRLNGKNIKGYRFLITNYNYWVFYTFSDTQLEVLRIVHTSQNFDS